MPEYVHNRYGPVDHDLAQTAHYMGSNTDGMKDTLRAEPSGPAPPPRDIRYSPGAAAAARAAGVRAGAQESAYPTIPIPRKAISTADEPAAPLPQTSVQRKPVRERPTKIAIPSAEPVQRQQKPLSPQSSPAVQTQPRPESRNSFFGLGKITRTETTDSSVSRQISSRRDSLTKGIKSAGRRLSDAFKDATTIIQMKPTVREDWMETRREEKKRTTTQDERRSSQLAQSESKAVADRAPRVSLDLGPELVAAEGKPLPKTPADLPVADLSLNAAQLRVARQDTKSKFTEDLAIDRKSSPPPPHFIKRETSATVATETKVSAPRLTKGERVAVVISKTVDGLKTRGRSNTAESDMSFGMTDQAPAEMMNACIRCNRPPTDFLHSSGLCNTCHVYQRQQEVLSTLKRK